MMATIATPTGSSSNEDAGISELRVMHIEAVHALEVEEANLQTACREWKENTDMSLDHELEVYMKELEQIRDFARDNVLQAKDILDKGLKVYETSQTKRAPLSNSDEDYRVSIFRRAHVELSNLASDDLVKFWKACRERQVVVERLVFNTTAVAAHDEAEEKQEEREFSYLVMPNSVAILGLQRLYGDTLLVRSHYPVLFQEWMAADENSSMDGLTGTPGIGKSFFLLYALCRLGMERYEHPIVFQDSDGNRLLFYGDAVQEERGLDFRDYLCDPKTIFLVDGAVNSLPVVHVNARVFLVAPPDRRVYGSFVKATKLSLMVAPVCTLHELLAVRQITSNIRDALSEDDVKRAFLITGGSAQALAYWAADANRSPEDQVNAQAIPCNLDQCRYNAHNAIASEWTIAHALFHLFPVPLASSRWHELRFASPYARRLFADGFVQQSEGELVKYLALPYSVYGFPSLRDALYEGYAVKRLVRGGSFKSCELKADGTFGQETIETLPAAHEQLFECLEEVREVRHDFHHRSAFGAAETLHTFMSGDWLFHFTTTLNTNVEVTDIEDVLRRLRNLNDETAVPVKARLFFVVPENVYLNRYEHQQQPQLIQHDISAKKPSGDLLKIRKYLLCSPIKVVTGS